MVSVTDAKIWFNACRFSLENLTAEPFPDAFPQLPFPTRMFGAVTPKCALAMYGSPKLQFD
jgi:hypothetical protein